jgi:hypothetical protein
MFGGNPKLSKNSTSTFEKYKIASQCSRCPDDKSVFIIKSVEKESIFLGKVSRAIRFHDRVGQI